MNWKEKIMFKYKEHFIFTAMMLLVSVMVVSIVVWVLNNAKDEQIHQTQRLLIQEATAHYSTIKEMEIWHRKFGGVFKESASDNDYRFNIYSLKPKNEDNRATGFVKDALVYLKEHPGEMSFQRFSKDNTKFDFVGVLYTQPRCIECHTDFTVGEMRGGIEIVLPMTNYNDDIKVIEKQFELFVEMIISAFVIGLGVIFYFMNKIFKNKEYIEQLNLTLELKVSQRTREIEYLYGREHYLKKLLETITELNEALINTYSLGSIIQTSMETLKHHPNYKLILFGYFDGEMFHKRYVSGDLYELFDAEHYSMDELKKNDIFKVVVEAITNQYRSLENEFHVQLPNRNRNRQEDYELTASLAFPMIEDEKKEGFDIIAFWSDREGGFDEEEIKILDAMVHDITMALSAYKQRKMTERLQQEQITNYEETILAFVDMIEQRDAYTAGHTLRVAKYSRMLAEYLKIDEAMIHKIEKAAILHDIGKIATPDTILLKPGRLNALEYELIKNHVTAGYNMLSKVKMYAQLAEIIKYHHEHYDGKGYPNGYKHDEIPMEGHILIIADAFDAMTTSRIYKARLTVQDAMDELRAKSGSQFHPDVIDAALNVLNDAVIVQTSQMPKNDLEKQRFSYFFNDNLTGLYNEAYLNLILHQIQNNFFVTIVRLRNFSHFNKEMSWAKGNELLVSIANQLKDLCPKGKIFRFEGDDFIVISPQEGEYKKGMLKIDEIDPKSIVVLESEYIIINNSEELYKLDPYISLI
jgi:two-component system sensor histidine kinase TtrS